METVKHVLIVGGGFGGINAAKSLGNAKGIKVTLIDRRNYHLFQPLLYQVAMADLAPADVCVPIREILAKYKNTEVILDEVLGVDFKEKHVVLKSKKINYDYLVLACGSSNQYFKNDHWAPYAPGLKSIENALQIRQKVLSAFERASSSSSPEERRKHLTFVVIGGGPTGVELAGALGEITRYSLAREFSSIDPTSSRIILIEGGKRILSSYPEDLSKKAGRALEELGVQIWTNCLVSDIEQDSVRVGHEHLATSNCIWAAGVGPATINKKIDTDKDRRGTLLVKDNCSLSNFPEVYVIGDQASFKAHTGATLPAIAPVAIQQGKYVGKSIKSRLKGEELAPFKYFDKGQMATIGRNKAILKIGNIKISGFVAWVTWTLVHINFLVGFRNRCSVLFRWVYAYYTRRRSSRIIYTETTPLSEGIKEIEASLKRA